MNILVLEATSEYQSEIWNRVLKGLRVSECYAVFLDKDEEEHSILSKEFKIKRAFYHRQSFNCDYSYAEDIMEEAPPVDCDLLKQMSEYEKQIFWMMERGSSREYNHRWRDYIKHLRFWNYVLEKYKIDLVLSQITSHEMYDYIIGVLCRIKHVKFYSGIPLAYPQGRFSLFSDIYNQTPDVNEKMKQLLIKYKDYAEEDIPLKKNMEEMYSFYRWGKDITPCYMKKGVNKCERPLYKFLYGNFSLARLLYAFYKKDKSSACFRYVNIMINRVKFLCNTIKSVFSLSCNTYKYYADRMYRKDVFREYQILLNYYKKTAVKADYTKKYIYIPLPAQPEASTSPLGGEFVDVLLMIKMLSYYLPDGYELYIKEHPVYNGYAYLSEVSSYRTLDFYNEIQGLKNTKLISFDEDTYKLINNASAVATITGTAGLEALFKGKIVFMFGYMFYREAPNAIPIRNNEDCIHAMDKMMHFKLEKNYFNKLRIFFKIMEKYVFPGMIDQVGFRYLGVDTPQLREESIQNIAKAYLYRINEDMNDNKLVY